MGSKDGEAGPNSTSAGTVVLSPRAVLAEERWKEEERNSSSSRQPGVGCSKEWAIVLELVSGLAWAKRACLAL